MGNIKFSEFGTVTDFVNDDYAAGYRGLENKRFQAQQIAKYTNAYDMHEVTFDSSDLNNSKLSVLHNLNTKRLLVWWFDNSWTLQSLSGLLVMTDLNKFEIDFGMDVEGTHTLYYKKF